MIEANKNIVEIKINSQTYKIACEKGQENHIEKLSSLINTEVENLVASLGQIGDARLLLMTCLIIADRLSEKENNNENQDYDNLLNTIKNITQRIEIVADKII